MDFITSVVYNILDSILMLIYCFSCSLYIASVVAAR